MSDNPYDFWNASKALNEAREERHAVAVWLADRVLNGDVVGEHAVAVYMDAVNLYEAARATYEVAAAPILARADARGADSE